MEMVIDPRGVVAGGKSYPAGTPLDEIRATAADLAAWRRFKQVQEPVSEAAPADEPDVAPDPVAPAPVARKPRKKQA